MIKKIVFLLLILLPLLSCSPPYKKSYNSAVRIGEGNGSGVLLDDGWHILTAAHVIDSNQNGLLENGETIWPVQIGEAATIYSASVVKMGRWIRDFAIDTKEDLALLKLDVRVEGGATLSSSEPSIGDEVYTIGCPNGSPLHITQGIISSFDIGLRRTSCAVYYGSSGGGLFSKKGEVIGILSMMNTDNNGFVRVPITTSSLFVSTTNIVAFIGEEYFIKKIDRKKNERLALLSIVSLLMYVALERKMLFS